MSVYIHLFSIFLLQFLYKSKYYSNIVPNQAFAQVWEAEPQIRQVLMKRFSLPPRKCVIYWQMVECVVDSYSATILGFEVNLIPFQLFQINPFLNNGILKNQVEPLYFVQEFNQHASQQHQQLVNTPFKRNGRNSPFRKGFFKESSHRLRRKASDWTFVFYAVSDWNEKQVRFWNILGQGQGIWSQLIDTSQII